MSERMAIICHLTRTEWIMKTVLDVLATTTPASAAAITNRAPPTILAKGGLTMHIVDKG